MSDTPADMNMEIHSTGLVKEVDQIGIEVDEFRHRIQALEANTALLFTTASAPIGKLRAAAAEALLAFGLVASLVEQTPMAHRTRSRLLKAMELLREALS